MQDPKYIINKKVNSYAATSGSFQFEDSEKNVFSFFNPIGNKHLKSVKAEDGEFLVILYCILVIQWNDGRIECHKITEEEVELFFSEDVLSSLKSHRILGDIFLKY